MNWSKEGWFVPVDYCVLNNQIRPKDHAAILRLAQRSASKSFERGEGQGVFRANVLLREDSCRGTHANERDT